MASRRRRPPEPPPPKLPSALARRPKLDPSHVSGRALRKLAYADQREYRDAVREHARDALAGVARMMGSAKVADAVRLRAMLELLDRGYGTPSPAPSQPDDGEGTGAAPVVVRGGLPD